MSAILSTVHPLLLAAIVAASIPGALAAEGDPVVVFAVVSKIRPDRRAVTAHVVAPGGTVEERQLLAPEALLGNPVWKKLEQCHALRAEVARVPEGYRVLTVKLLDAGMLPMSLQGLAGDCLLKKALEFAPQID